MDYSEQIEQAIKNHADAMAALWRLIWKVKRDKALDGETRAKHLTDLYSRLSTKDVKAFFVGDSIKYDVGVSFRSSLGKTRRFKSSLRQYGWEVAPATNSKVKDREFGSRLGVFVPETYAQNVVLEDLPIKANTIVKRMSGAGAEGVMHVDSSRRLHSVKTGRWYDTVTDANVEMPPVNKVGARTRWLAEEVVLDAEGELANDMKVYMFYGEPGIYLEIARRAGPQGEDLYAVHDAAHQPIELGPKVSHFPGNGVPDDVLEKARQVSLASPVPFLRVDFHMGATGCVLGEITPHPGGTYAGGLHDEVDRYLGKLYVDAEARLFIDLLGGKSFDTYEAVYNPRRNVEQ